MAEAPTSWSFVVPGQPRPWQRTGAFGRRRYTPTPTKAYQRTAATAAMLSRPRAEVTIELLDGV